MPPAGTSGSRMDDCAVKPGDPQLIFGLYGGAANL
jgi:hypothetical protein